MDIKKKKNIWRIVVMNLVGATVFAIFNLFGKSWFFKITHMLIDEIYRTSELTELSELHVKLFWSFKLRVYIIFLSIATLIFATNYFVKNINLRLRIIISIVSLVMIEYGLINTFLVAVRGTYVAHTYFWFRPAIIVAELLILNCIGKYTIQKLQEKYDTSVSTE